MLSTAADLVSLAGTAPWLAVAVVCLLAAAWVYRQSRRALADLRAELAVSAVRQGRRLGRAEQLLRLEQTRRRQTEAWLIEHGARLPYWPPDGADQPRPPARDDEDLTDAPADEEDLADEDPADDFTREAPRVPPLPDFPRHRR